MAKGTFRKGLLLLEMMAAEARELSLGQACELTGLEKSRACRLLKSLVEMGYVIRDPRSRRYRIGLRTLELSASILSRMELRRAGLTYLRDLSDAVGATSYLGVLHLGKVLVVETVYPRGVYEDGVPGFGSVMELHDSAMGKILLANMPEQQRTAALHDEKGLAEELEVVAQTGIAFIVKLAVAMPACVGVATGVKNCQGQVIAGMGASLLKSKWDQLDQDGFNRAVRNAAEGLSFALGHAASRLSLTNV